MNKMEIIVSGPSVIKGDPTGTQMSGTNPVCCVGKIVEWGNSQVFPEIESFIWHSLDEYELGGQNYPRIWEEDITKSTAEGRTK